MSLSLLKYIVSTERLLFFVIDGDISGCVAIHVFLASLSMDQPSLLHSRECSALAPRSVATISGSCLGLHDLGLNPNFCHFLSVGTQVNDSTTPCLKQLICKMGKQLYLSHWDVLRTEMDYFIQSIQNSTKHVVNTIVANTVAIFLSPEARPCQTLCKSLLVLKPWFPHLRDRKANCCPSGRAIVRTIGNSVCGKLLANWKALIQV